jgi:glutamate synthase domain-containing protein 3
MSGGIAYVVDDAGDFSQRCNLQMVDLENLDDDAETAFVRETIARHAALTKSERAQAILSQWEKYRPKIVKVMPLDFRRVLAERSQQAGKTFAMVHHG